MKVYEYQITVSEKDLDELNHVNNVVFVQWVQDIAASHWLSVSTAELRKKYSWVVLRHEIEYTGAAFLHNVLRVKTWVQHSAGVRSERHVEFYNLKTNRLLVRAKTIWCLLDAITLRPKRIEADIIKLFCGEQ